MAKILIIDIGNTRMKWAGTAGKGYTLLGEASHSGALDPIFWGQFPHRESVDKIVIASVLGASNEELISRGVAMQTGVVPNFVYSQKQAFGITNAYAQPDLLGVDRWLAMIGARSMSDRAFCVVDIGTAITVDAVDIEGNHLGGIIAPGFRLMSNSLTRHAQQLRNIDPGDIVTLADTTGDAIISGVHWSIVGLLERAIENLKSQLGVFDVFLTGGDSSRVAPYLEANGADVHFHLTDGLVLNGLSKVALEFV